MRDRIVFALVIELFVLITVKIFRVSVARNLCKWLIVWGIILFFGLLSSPALAESERVVLTLPLFEERLNTPSLNEGIATINLQDFTIDLSNDNAQFRDRFYQELQTHLNRSKQPLGLDLSNSSIKGDFITSKLGLPTALSKAALPQLLMLTEQEQLERDRRFLSEPGEQITSVIVFRGLLKLEGALLTGKTDFSKTFFLQRVEAANAKFTQESNWSDTHFYRTVNFTKAIFSREINFSNSLFEAPVKFRQVQFKGVADFNNSFFESEVNFSQSQFLQLANFTQDQWLKTVDFSQINGRDRLIFSKNQFFNTFSLSNSTLEKSVAFRGTQFEGLIDLEDIKLLDQIDFSNAIFLDNASINVAGLAFESDNAKFLGETGVIGQAISLPNLVDNETVVHNLILNFRQLEQIADANQIEYKSQKLKLKELGNRIIRIRIYLDHFSLFKWIKEICAWLFLSLLLLLSNYGTNFSLVFGIGILTIAYFGMIFWLIDRWRRRTPEPILPNRYDWICMVLSFTLLTILGMTNVLQASEQPWITLLCLDVLLFPLPLFLILRLYQQGRYHDQIDVSYFISDGSMRELRLLIVRLPVVPEFPFFRDRYTPLVWERRWNWLNYYDFSCNNLIKLGFNDIRLRDRDLPSIISTLAWYQWGLGILYITLLLWTLSRTIPGLNLLIYLK